MKRFLLLILLSALSVGGYAQSPKLQVGAERMELLLPLLGASLHEVVHRGDIGVEASPYILKIEEE